MTALGFYGKLNEMPFNDLLGSGYLEIMEQRLHGEVEELVWPRQVRDLVALWLGKNVTVLEAGCCLGTAYRAFEATGVKYIGLDYEPKYLAIAKEWYKNDLSVSFVEHDVTKGPLPQTADIIICSATLEHCPGSQPALKYFTDAAKQVLVLRTFLGAEEEIAYQFTAQKQKFYTNQYAFRDILGYLSGRGFSIKVFRDRYTDSVPQLQNGAIRTFYIVLAERIR